MEIQLLNLDEIEIVKPLWEELNSYLHSGSSHFKDELAKRTFSERINSYMEKANAAPYLIQVVSIDEKLIGYALASIDGEHVGEIDSIYIKQEFRKRKIGDTLVQNMLEFFDQNKTKYDRLNITEGNFGVEEFYNRFGFQTRRYVMHREK